MNSTFTTTAEGPAGFRRGTEKDIGGCAIAGILSEEGRRFSGKAILESIAAMRERSNGLGGGFAAYGIYPEQADRFALHLMFDRPGARDAVERVLPEYVRVCHEETIPTRPVRGVSSPPLLHRYFVEVRPEALLEEETEEDVIVRLVMRLNTSGEGAYVFSSGRNMGIFKGVGYPEEIGRFYRLEEYEGYLWLAHGRFPTNTPGWWGGAHPFGLLDWAVVHNGEISSYGTNRRFLESFGYRCALRTDTEVIAYLFDLLLRKHRLPLQDACRVLAPPFWTQIERLPPSERQRARTLRIVYAGALLNGPFSVLVGYGGGMIGLNDRTKLRPMAWARKDSMFYVASEEAAIRCVCPDPAEVGLARGGVPILGPPRREAVHA